MAYLNSWSFFEGNSPTSSRANIGTLPPVKALRLGNASAYAVRLISETQVLSHTW